MKKIILLLFILTVILAGCGGKAPAETNAPATTEAPVQTTAATEPEPTETEPPVPETVSGTVLADKTAVVLTMANRGDAVDIVDQFDEAHYVLKMETGYGLIEKRLVRLEGEEAYAEWDGYAKSGAVLYPSYNLSGEGTKLNNNAELKILADLGDCYLVTSGEITGYMAKDTVSEVPISYSGWGGGGGGGEWTPPAM
jgi:hypothetical protein